MQKELMKMVWEQAIAREFVGGDFVSVFRPVLRKEKAASVDRTILLLRFVGGYSMREIAAQINLSSKTVCLRIKKILQRLGLEGEKTPVF